MDYMNKYKTWLTDPCFDDATKEELASIAGNEEEIRDRFYTDLRFGTGGLRGVMGAGTNRMNIYTIRKATQGLCNYILETGGADKGVAIAFDSRHHSAQFAMETALCLCANHIPAWIFDDLRPTPELSFAVRDLGCIAGVVVTASHNPPQYNGYKVYWQDGGQITPGRAGEIIAQIDRIGSFSQVKTTTEETAKQTGLLHVIDSSLDERYLANVKAQMLHPECARSKGAELKIVYTPLHGTGCRLAPRILKGTGFPNVITVPEQASPDGDFPTVISPNPEDKRAFKLALALAEKENADLVLATDPDADRLGVYVKDAEGCYRELTGNMSGMLLCEYELSQRKALGTLPANGAIVKTIVTGNMSKAAAAYYDVAVIETLTGFKFIGEKIKEFEENHSYEYVFGYEESYGCLIGTYARDKDAIVAVMALCEAAAYYASHGKTLWEQMLSLYERYGYYKEDLLSFTLPGENGAAQIAQKMQAIRTTPPTQIGGFKVTGITDYLLTEKTGLPSSNVLQFTLEDDGWCAVRPSGTEPKIKYYLGVKGTSLENADNRLQKVKEDPFFKI